MVKANTMQWKNKVVDTYNGIDMFGQPVSWTIGGMDSPKTCCGATLTLIVAFLTIAYAYIRFDVLLKRDDTKY